MLTRKTLILVTCIIVLLTISGTAWGEINKPGDAQIFEANPPGALKFEQERITLRTSPWPTLYGNPDRARCSDYEGPGGKLVVETPVNLFGVYNLGYIKQGKEFRGFLVGPGNDIYFYYWTNYISTIYAYRPSTGPLWEATIKDQSNFCLDRMGRVYYLQSYGQDYENRYEIISCNPDGTINWFYRFGPAEIIDILTVGKRVYVGAVTSQKFYITAINLDGTEAWKKGLYDYGYKSYCAEDDDGNAYLRFEDEELGIHKFSEDGDHLWQVPLVVQGGVYSLDFGSGTKNGPICVGSGRVWSDEGDVGYPGDGNAVPLFVLNDDGSFYKTGHFEPGKMIAATCYGKDGRLYVGQTAGVIKCYDNFDQEVWSTQLPAGDEAPPGGFVSQMILDSENIIYVIYVKDKERVLYVLDPSDGHKLGSEMIKTAGEQGHYNWLAIGENEKLIWLNSKGYVKVFRGPLEISPEIMEAKPSPLKPRAKINGDD